MRLLLLVTIVLSSVYNFSEASEITRTCRIVFVDPPRNAPRKVQLFDGTSTRKVYLPDKNLSEVINLPAGDLVLSMMPDHVLDPENLPQGAPTVTISAKVTDFYLIVVSDPENEVLPLRMLPVDVDHKKPKLGQTLWINLTAHAIKANFGSEPLTIPPDSRVIGEGPLPSSGYYKAEFEYQANGEGEFLPVMKKSWWFDTSSKNIGFIVNSGRRLPRIFSFRDKAGHVEPKKAE